MDRFNCLAQPLAWIVIAALTLERNAICSTCFFRAWRNDYNSASWLWPLLWGSSPALLQAKARSSHQLKSFLGNTPTSEGKRQKKNVYTILNMNLYFNLDGVQGEDCSWSRRQMTRWIGYSRSHCLGFDANWPCAVSIWVSRGLTSFLVVFGSGRLDRTFTPGPVLWQFEALMDNSNWLPWQRVVILQTWGVFQAFSTLGWV